MDERRRTHVVLPELDTCSMPLNNLLNQIGNSTLILESTRMIPFNPTVIRRESTLDAILQDGETVGAHFSVILNILNEPPWTISTVVSWVSGRVEQVGDKTVLEGGTECEDMISSSGEVSSGKEETSERDELGLALFTSCFREQYEKKGEAIVYMRG
jgi:hypothetical protein